MKNAKAKAVKTEEALSETHAADKLGPAIAVSSRSDKWAKGTPISKEEDARITAEGMADYAAELEKENAAVTAWAANERAIEDLRDAVGQELLEILNRFEPLGVKVQIWASNVGGQKQSGVNIRPTIKE